MFTIIDKCINFSSYAFYSPLLGLFLAHNVIMNNLIRSSNYNHIIYMLFTDSLVLSLAHSNF